MVTCKNKQIDRKSLNVLIAAAQLHQNAEGWTSLNYIAGYLRKHSTKYIKNRFGYKNLTKVLLATGIFQLQTLGADRCARLLEVGLSGSDSPRRPTA